MKIMIEVIPHESQRYPTCGDWYYTESGDWHIKVSTLADWRYTFLIAFHELIEMALCRFKGVSEAEVTAFDEAYEARRLEGDMSECGDDTNAPYFWEHQIATMFERVMARLLGVAWDDYDHAVNEL